MTEAIQGGAAVREERLQKAFAMYDEGKSVNEVGRVVYKNYWIAAKKAKDAWLVSRGETPAPVNKPAKKKAPKKKAKRVAEPVPAEEEAVADDAPESLECAIVIPIGRADDIFAEFTACEKATAIQAVLQERMDAALGAG
jgi:hypothetical protein